MNNREKIPLFWWSSVKFEGKSQENFGDLLSKYLVEKISGKKTIWKHPKKLKWNPFHRKIYLTTGSILAHATKRCIVWGSGIISAQDEVEEAEFLAVRGPETYNYLINKGYRVNKVFGDPAILLHDYFKPDNAKTHNIGIIPHYVDYEKVASWYSNDDTIKIINLLNNNIEEVIEDIASCKCIISSSLHGVIVSHTYNIPAIWVKFSQKLSGDDIKFADYFNSVNLKPYNATFVKKKLNESELISLLGQFPNSVDQNKMFELRKGLMEACPFK